MARDIFVSATVLVNGRIVVVTPVVKLRDRFEQLKMGSVAPTTHYAIEAAELLSLLRQVDDAK
ncbi:MAG: hypothetical protein KAJ06_11835 [Gammaproteobacteria bacterium]|nr:hypothetical protein [Gammaproteobacteria bacterium]